MQTKCGDFWIGKEDLPNNEVGRVMLDIVFCSPNSCRDKKAFLELVEYTAEEIIKRFANPDKNEVKK